MDYFVESAEVLFASKLGLMWNRKTYMLASKRGLTCGFSKGDVLAKFNIMSTKVSSK